MSSGRDLLQAPSDPWLLVAPFGLCMDFFSLLFHKNKLDKSLMTLLYAVDGTRISS